MQMAKCRHRSEPTSSPSGVTATRPRRPRPKLGGILHFALSSTPHTWQEDFKCFASFLFTLSQVHAHNHSKPMSGYPPKKGKPKNHNLKIALKLCKGKNIINVLDRFRNVVSACRSGPFIPHPHFHSPDRSLLTCHPPAGLENTGLRDGKKDFQYYSRSRCRCFQCKMRIIRHTVMQNSVHHCV